jgi:putative tributyrin esterase
MRHTNIERYATEACVAVVMPSGDWSWFCNMIEGPNYYDYIVEELPELMREFLPRLSELRQDNTIAGLSMGGSAALRIGLLNPQRYGRICVLSSGSVVPFNESQPETTPLNPRSRRARQLAFGTDDLSALRETDFDVTWLVRQLLSSGRQPPEIYHATGTEDPKYPTAQAMRQYFEQLPGNPFRYEYEQGPGGHDWPFWDRQIVEFMKRVGPKNETPDSL